MIKKNQTKIIAEAGKQELFITREFNAPKDLVFRAFTEPDLLIQWLGPKDQKMRIDKYENKSGGYWRFIHTDEKGNEFAFNGVIHEIFASERIIRTFEFEGMPERGHVVLETSLFSELPGERTSVTIHSVFKSIADRDGMVMSGMERGVVDSHERMDELFKKVIS